MERAPLPSSLAATPAAPAERAATTAAPQKRARGSPNPEQVSTNHGPCRLLQAPHHQGQHGHHGHTDKPPPPAASNQPQSGSGSRQQSSHRESPRAGPLQSRGSGLVRKHETLTRHDNPSHPSVGLSSVRITVCTSERRPKGRASSAAYKTVTNGLKFLVLETEGEGVRAVCLGWLWCEGGVGGGRVGEGV